MDRKGGEREQLKARYRQQYEEVLAWLNQNEHLRESRSKLGETFKQEIVRATAALIAILELINEIPIPQNVDWKAYRGYRTEYKSKIRSCVTMHLQDVSRLTGISLPIDLKDPGTNVPKQYIGVIWRADEPEEDLSVDMVKESNFITAYSVAFSDQIAESTQDKYKWHVYGRSKARADLLKLWDQRTQA